MGFAPAASGSAGSSSGSLQPIQIDQANIAPTATSTLTMGVNLPASDGAIDTSANPFSITNPKSYNESTTTTVFDSLGANHSLTTFFTQVSGSGSPNQWQTHWELTDSGSGFVAF